MVKKGVPVPDERHETVRREIISLLQGPALSALEISSSVRIPAKEVLVHLEHIHRTMHRHEEKLHVIPAECSKCGFVFKKRGRFSAPGRCPVCRSEHITDPLFSINPDVE